MKVKDYLKKFPESTSVTFIEAKAVKYEHAPGYRADYRTTPINHIWEWKESSLMDCYILNNKQQPIDWLSGANWGQLFKDGRLLSLLVISKENLELLYSPEQAESLIKSIDKKINE